MDCEEIVNIKEAIKVGGARCATRRCKRCHNARKSLRSWYHAAGRTKEWENMSLEDRRELVKKNKDKGCGKGHRRKVIVSEAAECVDKLQLAQSKPFLTKKQLPGWLVCASQWS